MGMPSLTHPASENRATGKVRLPTGKSLFPFAPAEAACLLFDKGA
jgi:hypothetical protein